MKKIDRDKFLFLYQNDAGTLGEAPKASLLQLLDFLEGDEKITDIRHAAYMLATAKHETGRTYAPVREDGKGQGFKYGVADPVTGKAYYGRGYVQLTWKDNYKEMGRVLKLDLVNDPDLALYPDTAYRIMSYGMRVGAFTGVGLSRYLHDDVTDFTNARRIINGTDCAERIARYAQMFLNALQGAQTAEG